MPYIPVQQAMKENPDYVKQNYPQVYSQYTQQVEQPGASLQSTQTSTAATGASIPGIQAESGIKQIQQQQVGAQSNLGKDLANKMTLGSALKKYTALGMNADDVFKQYLAESPHGMPKENPQELQNLGISDRAIGQIGTPGSFIDRYNTKNAISGLRNLEDLWNKTNAASRVAGMLGLDVNTSNYNTAKEIFGNHLSTLIPGAPGGQQTANDLLNTLPNPGNPTENIPGKATGQFSTIEDQLLKTKGYAPKDLGIASRPDQQPKNGGNILTTLLGSAMNTAQDVGTGIRNNQEQTTLQKNSQQANQLENEAQNTVSPTLKKLLLGEANQIRTRTSNEASDISRSFSSDVNQNPIIRALTGAGEIATVAELPGLAKGAFEGGGNILTKIVGSGAKSEAGATAENQATKIPGKLSQMINPQGTKDVGSAIRDQAVKQAEKVGSEVSGDNITKSMNTWREVAKAANPGASNAAKIDDIADGVVNQYKGKAISAPDAQNIYNEIDSGFTRSGLTKETIQGSADQALRTTFRQELEKAAPGFEKGTSLIGKGFQADKGAIPAMKKNLLPRAVGAGLGLTGLDFLRHTLGI